MSLDREVLRTVCRTDFSDDLAALLERYGLAPTTGATAPEALGHASVELAQFVETYRSASPLDETRDLAVTGDRPGAAAGRDGRRG